MVYDPFLEEDVKTFIKIMKQDAKSCQRFSYSNSRPSSSASSSAAKDYTTQFMLRSDTSEKLKIKPQTTDKVCLYPPHKARELKHLLRDCESRQDHMKKNILPD